MEALELWTRIMRTFKSTLENDTDRNQADRYLSMISRQTLENGTLKLYATSESAIEYIKNNYGEKLRTCAMLLSEQQETSIVFEYDQTARPRTAIPVSPRADRQSATKFTSTMPLTREYTFDEFVTGPSNSWAHAAAQGVVREIGKSNDYNPLLIYGGTGLGKTHLMQAVGNEIIRTKPQMSVCYLTAETFLNEFVNALKNGSIDQFRTRYRKIDLLLVDDIQFIAQRTGFQDEFFNTFNALHGAKKHIIMTSDVAPKNLHDFDQRLISRFEGGIVQEIDTPSYETRLAILRKKAEGTNPPIPEECLNFIAENIESHVRALNGALGKVKLMLKEAPSLKMTDDMLKHLLGEFIEKEKNLKKITVQQIQQVIAQKYGVTMQQMLSSERTQSIVTPRQLAMYIARKYTTKSLKEIADAFGKSHATIIHGAKTISKRIDVEPELHSALEEIVGEFGYKITDTVD